jgi:hypothetical protein
MYDFANEMTARYCRDQQLPALYVTQPPPDETVLPASAFPTSASTYMLLDD